MTDSWWLKVKRAQKHMVDIKREARNYASRHPYKLIRIRYPDGERKVGYRMRITEQPDPMIAVMFGDFVHNLRSALDHIFVASVPRNRRYDASFPIIAFEDIWAKDTDGKFVVNDPKGREDFENAVRGLAPNARALVIRAQPYRMRDGAETSILGAISRLENADKHRQLIVVGGGVLKPIGVVSIRGETVPLNLQMLPNNAFAKDDTIIGWEWPDRRFPDGTVIKQSDVDMQFTGITEILVKVTRRGGNKPPYDFRLKQTMLDALRDVRRVLRLMEPFVIR